MLEGIASTPAADRTGDVMEPAGAQFTLPMPLLWQHKHDRPIGHVLSARVTDAGILVRAQIAKGIPFVDEAWSLIKARLVGGLSIGWRPLEAPEPIQQRGQTVGLRFKRWEWLELSAVTVPMNAQTSILSVKSIDAADRAALGIRSPVITPGASGSQSPKAMNISEQLTAQRAELQTKSARLEELTNPEGDLSAADLTERDTLMTDVQAQAKHIERLADARIRAGGAGAHRQLRAAGALRHGAHRARRDRQHAAEGHAVRALRDGRRRRQGLASPTRSPMRSGGTARRRRSAPTSRRSPARRSSARRPGAVNSSISSWPSSSWNS